ncbi:MAG: GrpB family protein [Clostridia bacterium]|nr:GrpB family protein [Clostridia bacterium]
MARKIEVVAYRPEWAKMFAQEAKQIKKILGKNCVWVHHIGSTAVKGLAAKPIIDIMPVVKDLSAVDLLDKEFEAIGYECKGEFGIPGRRFYTKGGDERTHHIHIFAQSSKDDIERHLAVRNYLQSAPEEAKKYAELKIKLAEEFTYDNEGYCDGKDAFVKELEKKALEWSKRQSHMSSCISIGMCLGLCLGSALGASFGNISMGMCIGVALGMCIGTSLGASKYRSGEDENDDSGDKKE